MAFDVRCITSKSDGRCPQQRVSSNLILFLSRDTPICYQLLAHRQQLNRQRLGSRE